MNKKALSTMEWIIYVALGVFIVVILTLIFPNLIGTAVKGLFSLAASWLPYKSVTLENKNPIPPAFDKYFDDLTMKLKSIPPGQNCIVPLTQMPSGDGYSISLYNNKASIEKTKSDALTPAYKSVTLTNFKPCSVEGSNALSFHQCFIEKNQAACKKPMVAEPSTLQIDPKNSALFLMKVNDKLCFVKTYDDRILGINFDSSCNQPKNQGTGGIDRDCLQQLSKLPVCG